MADPGHEETEEIIRQIERRINKEYKQAEKEVSAKLDDYLRSFEKKDERWQEWVADGVKTEAEYKKWRTGQIAIGERWTEMRDDLAKDLANTSKIARSIAQEYMPEVYATNFNYGTYDIEHQAKVSTSFTLYSRESVERLMRDDPEVLPGPGEKVLSEIAMGKAVRWEKTELQSAMLQGLLQGESIPALATRVANTVGDSDRKAAIRNARTMATGVQNAGRIDSYNRARKMGIELEKQWLATLDSRTRHSHRMLDGQTVPVNDPFVAEYGEIMYPGDPAGDPADVYNCRCTLISQVKGFETDVTDMSLRRDDKLGDMSYEEWKAQKKSESNPITLPEEKARNIKGAYVAEYRGKWAKGRKSGGNDEKTVPKDHTEEYNRLKSWMEKDGVKNVPVNDLEKQLTRQEIIDKLAGGDMTKGSCASLALSYCGNVAGMDVTDFRGGNSQEEFSMNSAIENMLKVANADIKEYKVKKEAKETAEILKGLDVDKEYLLSVGKHCAIVRNTSEHGVEYLEMQSGISNGWKPLATKERTTSEGLIQRFKCRKTEDFIKISGKKVVHEKKVILSDVSTFEKNDEIKEMLGYINTAAGKQKKGVKGFAK